MLTGGAELGTYLVDHPDIAKIAFTGSTVVGRRIMQSAGPALKRVTLELGGNDAAIVLDDADVDAIGDRLFRSAFFNAGQVCVAAKRIFAHESVYGDVVDALAARAEDSRLGHGLDPATQMGPINNRPQFERIDGLVRSARDAGAKPVAGGYALQGTGFFYRPTIVTDLDPDHALVVEEQFGPVVPVLSYRYIEDAIAMAGRGPYGLGGSIWTSDPQRARGLASALDVGTVWINHHAELRPDVPFGGARDSGIGYENGEQVLDAYSQLQVVNTWHS